MKILVTSPYVCWPADFGGAVRTVNIVRALVGLGHQVVLLTATPAGEPGRTGGDFEWRSYPSSRSLAHFYNPAFRRSLLAALNEGPDLVLAEFPYQACMLLGPARKAGIPVVYDAHNVEADRFRSMNRPFVAAMVRFTESCLCRHARGILATSESDRLLLQRQYHVSSKILPNGADLTRFVPSEPDAALCEEMGLAGSRVALFFGTYDYQPNREALDFLVNRVWPEVVAAIPDARLLVVGRNAPEWAYGVGGITTVGVVDDIVPYIQLANVVLAPIFSGGGTRLKIIEALACGQKVLSTPFGAQGLTEDGSDALILAEKGDFARALISVLRKGDLPGKSGSARQLAMQYDWSRIVATIDWDDFVSR